MKTHLLTAGAAILIGFVGAWYILKPKVVPETPAPEVRHADGSLTLERKPATPKTAPHWTPKVDLPAGSKVEREVQVTISPKQEASPSKTDSLPAGGLPQLVRPPGTGVNIPQTGKSPFLGAPGAKCPPLTVNLALVRLKDQSHRVVASSPDGDIVGGVDIPVEPVKIPKIPRWTVEGLAGYDTHVGRNVWGGAVSYSRGPIVFQGGVIGGTGFVGAGVRF